MTKSKIQEKEKENTETLKTRISLSVINYLLRGVGIYKRNILREKVRKHALDQKIKIKIKR